MNDRSLAYLGTPDYFTLAPGCYVTKPLLTDADNDNINSQVTNYGFAEWMGWADE